MIIDIVILKEGLKLLAAGASLSGMRDSPIRAIGGIAFWNTLAYEKGWRVQQNQITQHYRVLKPNNKRVIWSNEEKILELFRILIKDPNNKHPQNNQERRKINKIEKNSIIWLLERILSILRRIN